MSSKSGSGKRKLGNGDGSGFEAWGGYMPAKIRKLQEQYREGMGEEATKNGTRTSIFNGISIFVNGYTKPSSAELKKLMMQHGGTYHHYYQRELVTHIIANNLPNSKIMNITDKKIVSPDWISDSIKAGKLLSYENYLLYTNRSKLQPGMKMFAKKISKPVLPVAPSSSTSSDSHRTGGIPDQSNQEENITGVTQDIIEKESGTKKSSSDHDPEGRVESCDILVSEVKANISTAQNLATVQLNKPARPSLESVPGPRNIGDARDPNFLSEFYNNSRLHHISTWGAEYKAYVSRLHAAGDTSFPGRDKLREMVSLGEVEGEMATGLPKRVIMHIDMDCFFVSVGLRKRPDLIGKPVAVTHSKGKGNVREREGTDLSYEASHWGKKGLKLRKGPGKGKMDPTKMDLERNPDLHAMMDTLDVSDDEEGDDEESKPSKSLQGSSPGKFNSMAEIASCNYEARKAGVKNGMFMGAARALCPELETIPYDFDGYREVSQLLYDTVASFTHDIEAVSCDEMFVDCTDLLADTGATPLQFASLLRQIINNKTNCDASAGIGPNILLARMATRIAKPNGQYELRQDEAMTFLKDQPVRDLPGVGRAMSNKFATMNVRTCGELQSVSLQILQRDFGPKTGQSLYRYCRGQDDRPIKCEQERKSVSAEVNYGIRFKSESDVERFVTELAGEVSSRLKKLNVKGKTISLKLKVRAHGAPKETAKFLGHGICDNVTKSSTIPMPTDSPLVIGKEVMGILRLLRIPPSEHRGVGIQVSRLEAPVDVRSSSSRGNQSILNFATKAQPASPKAATKIASNKAQQPPISPELDTNSALISLPAKDSTTGLDHQLSTREKSTEEKNEIRGDKTAGTEDNDFRKSCDRTMEQPVVKSGEGPTLRNKQKTSNNERSVESVFRSKNPVVLPRLPKLPTFLSPQASISRPPAEVSETPPGPAVVEDILLPSPSQVDPEVLRELPDDIRHQIEGAMAANRSKRQTRSTTRSQTTTNGQESAPPPQEAGSSQHSASTMVTSCDRVEQTSSAHTRPMKKQEEPIVALPSLSQLDPTCLDALPPDMREELLQAYQKEVQGHSQAGGRPHPSTSHQPPLIHPLMLAKNQNSPKHAVGKNSPSKRSPGKATHPSNKLKTSPVFKKPRGNKPGRPRKKLNFGKKSVQITDTNKTQPQPPAQPLASTQGSDSHEDGTVGNPSTKDGNTQPSGVNLCGAVTLAEVKDLLREWTLSSDAPEEEDVMHLTRYLHELVADMNLERLHQVLLYMRRCLKKRPLSAEWENTYQLVVNEAQAVIQINYGSRLNL